MPHTPRSSVERTRTRALEILNKPAPAPARQQPPARCFLCDYSTTPEVKFVTSFIADNVANMDLGLMAEQISEYICKERPELLQDGESEAELKRRHGIDVGAVCRHVRMHMLCPTVRIADMMRHLLKLCDSLRSNLEKVDPDTGESVLDRGNVDTYLKVVTKVLDMYKMSETSKMLFAHEKPQAQAT